MYQVLLDFEIKNKFNCSHVVYPSDHRIKTFSLNTCEYI